MLHVAIAQGYLFETGIGVEQQAAYHLDMRQFDLLLAIIRQHGWIMRGSHRRRFRDGPVIIVEQQIAAWLEQLLAADRCQRIILIKMSAIQIDEVEHAFGPVDARAPRQHCERPAIAVEGAPRVADNLDIVVSVLPLTPETTGIMNEGFFGMLADGAYIINGGRGPQVNDEDLLAALASGKLGGAALDVFAVEPLPQDHPFWAHPKIRVWPHVAAQTNATSAAGQVAAAITAMMNGSEPANRVDWSRGY